MGEYALRLENAADTAPRVRAGDALGLTPNGTTARARGGLRVDGGGAVTVSSGTMTVNVAPLVAWVDAPLSGQVGFPFVLDASKALTIDAGDASLVRIDVIAVVVRENAFDSGGSTTGSVEVIKGTPGAGAPSLPNAAVPLRNISVHAGASSGSGGLTVANLSTDRRVWTVAAGGILPVANQTVRDALPSTQMVRIVQRLDTGNIEVYDPVAGAWTALAAVFDTGWVAIAGGLASPKYRAKQGWVSITVAGSVVITNDNNTTLVATGGIPTAYRPSNLTRGVAFVGGKYAGIMTVNTDGSVQVIHQAGSTQSTVSGTVIYPIG